MGGCCSTPEGAPTAQPGAPVAAYTAPKIQLPSAPIPPPATIQLGPATWAAAPIPQGGLNGLGPAKSGGPSTNLEPNSLCMICRNINFQTLPSEVEPGTPHQPSLAALKVSARTCTLCAMILQAAMTIRDDVNAEFNGQPKSAWIGYNPTIDKPDGKKLQIRMIQGRYSPGTHMGTGPRPGEPEQERNFVKQFPFESDDVLKPWLFGSWWELAKDQGPTQLIGLGVRLGRLPDVEYGEGNKVNKQTESGTVMDSITLRGTFLRFRTRVDSPFALYIPGRLVTMESSSPMSFKRIRAWLSDCDTAHRCMPRDTPLPTRILDVGVTGQNFISLVDGGGRIAPFLALSHRWGVSHRITLTKATIGQFMDSIALSSIPKTFNDAVQIARTLNIRYLWIDSLCIIQDDPQDWEQEAARMAGVYANAYLTIAASFSEDDSSGCFPPWSLRSTLDGVSADVQSHAMPPIYAYAAPLLSPNSQPGGDPNSVAYMAKSQYVLMAYGPTNSTAEITISKEWMASSLKSKPSLYCIPHFGRPFDEPGIQPLASRGWTLQERYLSPRTLHFCPAQMYWECMACQVAEDGSRITPRDNNLARLISSQLIPWNTHGLGSVTGISLIEGYPPTGGGSPAGRWDGGWLALIKDYTSRKLTVQNDKLPALSGLASRLADMTGDEYLAGLWKGHIIEDLFWRVQARVEQRIQVPGGFEHVIGRTLCVPKRPSQYRAPSWSWASLDDASIIFEPLDFGRILTTFVGSEVIPAGSDPYGRIRSGWMHLNGPLLTIHKAPPDYKPDPNEPLGFGVFMTVQTAGGLSYGEAYFDIASDTGTQCMALFLDPQNALLLAPVDGADGTFRRLGTAKFLRTTEQRISEPMYDPKKPGFNKVPYGPTTSVDGARDVVII